MTAILEQLTAARDTIRNCAQSQMGQPDGARNVLAEVTRQMDALALVVENETKATTGGQTELPQPRELNPPTAQINPEQVTKSLVASLHASGFLGRAWDALSPEERAKCRNAALVVVEETRQALRVPTLTFTSGDDA